MGLRERGTGDGDVATVTVRGRAAMDVEPDRVRLVVAVQAEAAVGAEALTALVPLSGALEAALDATLDLLLRRPSAVSLQPVWSREGELTGQAARRVVVVEARAGAPLGELLAAVSAVPGATVESTEWLVEPGNAVHGQVRGLAVADARQRAGDYARAAELRLGALEQITEPGMGDGMPRALGFMERAGGGGGGPVLELRPEPVSVGAEIDVRYALLPGSQV